MLNQWKEIGWYGVRFKIPARWQLGQIGIRYLLIEDESGPVMEIKWAPVKGRFSHQTHLKRLASLQKKKTRKSLQPQKISPEWATALTHFEAREFSWESDSTYGRGVILFCPACRKASLVQFFHQKRPPGKELTLNVLNSFRDHRNDGQLLWRAYDIRALAPETFELKRFKFEAGRYELEFAEGSQNVTLYRWAPASVLLNKQDLVSFARSVASFDKTEPVAGKMDGVDTVEWSTSPASDWGRWFSRFKLTPSYFWLGLWHLEAKNRIMGVLAESKAPLDTELLDNICTRYEIV